MRLEPTLRLFVFAAGVALCAVKPASADLTITGKYTLVSGDTLTRASYYTPKRVRVTAPDGREFVYNASAKQVMVIDHVKRIYWQGPVDQADSLANKLLLEKRKELKPQIEANREQWMSIMSSINDSLRVGITEETRTIAGYPCTKWLMLAGSYMVHERWVARSLSVANYGPELEKIVMASMLDPLGRVLMKQLIAMRSTDGLPLASTTRFRTLTQSGSFEWEAISVSSQPIPKSVWEAPKDYNRIHL